MTGTGNQNAKKDKFVCSVLCKLKMVKTLVRNGMK